MCVQKSSFFFVYRDISSCVLFLATIINEETFTYQNIYLLENFYSHKQNLVQYCNTCKNVYNKK